MEVFSSKLQLTALSLARMCARVFVRLYTYTCVCVVCVCVCVYDEVFSSKAQLTALSLAGMCVCVCVRMCVCVRVRIYAYRGFLKQGAVDGAVAGRHQA